MGSRTQAVVVYALLILGCGGCGTYQGSGGIPGSPLDRVPAATLDVSPAAAVSGIRGAIAAPPLSLNVVSAQDGIIVTDWKEYEGAVHIVRRWPERTRFYIVVNPDFGDPGHRSRVLVYDQTQEKADERKGWVDNPQLYRRSRSEEVLQAIAQHAASAAPAAH